MKILIAGHDLKFIKFYIDHLKVSKHEVKIDKWENHVAHNIQNSYELLNWADIIFCEWGLGNTIFYSQNKRENQRLVVRLHRQELETSYLTQADIEAIDLFITVSPFIYEEFSRTFNLPRKKMRLIYNNVDLNQFTNHNLNNREFHIGMVGYLPKLKRMDLALDIFENLYNEDNRYILHFKGKKPQELKWLWRIDEERDFYDEQFKRIESAEWRNNVVFEEFGDVVGFYNRMEFIFSLSDVESFHLAAAEGMACGAIPIITNWEGSETIYSNKFIIGNYDQALEYINYVRNNKSMFNKLLQKNIEKFSEIESIKSINNTLSI